MKVSKQKEDNIIIITSNILPIAIKLQIQRMSSTIHDQIRDTLQPANCSFLIDIRLLVLPNSIKASATQCWKTNQNVSIFELSYFLCNIDTNAKDSIEWTPILWKLALMDTKKLSNHWSINETAKLLIWILKTFMDGLHLWRLGQNLIKWDFLRQFSNSVCITIISWLFPIQNSLSFRDVNYSITKPAGTYLMYHDFVNSQFFLMMVLMWWRPYPLKTKLTVIVIGGVIQKVWEEHRAGWTHSPVTHV